MKTHSRTCSRSLRPGFTLVELLVVIAIIAALVTGAFGAFFFAIERARFADSQSMARTVANAVDQYENQYDLLPLPASATQGTDCESDTTAPEGLVATLLGIDTTQNSRKTNFLGDPKTASITGGKRVGGLIRDSENVSLVDSWGTPYKVTIDLDGNGRITNPNPEEASAGNPELYRSVIVYSAGKDRDFGTWKDNVTSWSPR
ncbi:MAG TPA: type II secretion system protein [Verrucomicrobiales bacterium]|nr:type II secretion system protein [Verrucomicrobiales bacterium]